MAEKEFLVNDDMEVEVTGLSAEQKTQVAKDMIALGFLNRRRAQMIVNNLRTPILSRNRIGKR